MTDPENTPAADAGENLLPPPPLPKLYSKLAIRGFSLFFSPIFGGVLLRQNLVDIGNKKAGNLVLLFSVAFSLAVVVVANLLAMRSKSTTLPIFLCYLFGSGLLADYFFNKYIPADFHFTKKPIWKPLLISLLITLPFLLAAIYTLGH